MSISTAAVIARENARHADGKFGSYQMSEAGIDADLDMDADVVDQVPATFDEVVSILQEWKASDEPPTPELLDVLFTKGLCFNLASYLERRFDGVISYALSDEDGDSFVHGFVFDEESEEYVDITGVTSVDGMCESIGVPPGDYFCDEAPAYIESSENFAWGEREIPDQLFEAALSLMVSRGWTPPPQED